MLWKPSQLQLDMAPFVKMAGYRNNLVKWRLMIPNLADIPYIINGFDIAIGYYGGDHPWIEDWINCSIYSTKTEYEFHKHYATQISKRYYEVSDIINISWDVTIPTRILNRHVVDQSLRKKLYKIKKRDERVLSHLVLTQHPEFPAELQAIVSSFL